MKNNFRKTSSFYKVANPISGMKNTFTPALLWYAFFNIAISLSAAAQSPNGTPPERCGNITGPVYANATAVSGTVNGAVAATTVNLYLDGQLIGSTITSTTTWGPIDVNTNSTNSLQVNNVLSIGVQEPNLLEVHCPSSALPVSCIPSAITPVFTPSNFNIFLNQTVTLTITNAVAGNFYTVMDSTTGMALGPGVWAMSNGPLNITTNPFTALGSYHIQIVVTGFSGSQCPPVSSTGTVNVSPPPLPITLVDFKGSHLGKGILLDWSTSSESQLNRFEIERSGNGSAFTRIGQVRAFGNSNTIKTYTFSDNAPLNSVNYYRLKMIDNDGKYAYSKLLVFNFGQPASVVLNSISPNPFRDAFTVNLALARSQTIQVQMLDQKGCVLYAKSFKAQAGNNSLWISDLVTLQAGIYYLRMITETGVMQERVMKEQ